MRETVDGGGVVEGDDVEPADAPGPPGGGAVLETLLAQVLRELAVELGGVRARAHAGSVRLGDADYSFKLVGRQP